jgi:hypothetical protein
MPRNESEREKYRERREAWKGWARDTRGKRVKRETKRQRERERGRERASIWYVWQIEEREIEREKRERERKRMGGSRIER